MSFRAIIVIALSAIFVVKLTGSAAARCSAGGADPLVTVTPQRLASVAEWQRSAQILGVVRSLLKYYHGRTPSEAFGFDPAHGAMAGAYYDVPLSEIFQSQKTRVMIGPDGVVNNIPMLGGPWPLFAPFDFRRPTGLLYTSAANAKGGSIPVGAVYTVHSVAPVDALDDIVPLSVARWITMKPLCLAAEDPWTLEVFPFRHDRLRNWQIPTEEVYSTVIRGATTSQSRP